METPQVILVVDDEPFVLDTISRILSYAGFRVLSAGSPEVAMRLAAESTDPIHLLISDVVMPGMRGPELSARFTELHPETRCLFIAGFPDEPHAMEEVVFKGRPMLPKPFLPQTLIQKVREILGGENLRAGATA